MVRVVKSRNDCVLQHPPSPFNQSYWIKVCTLVPSNFSRPLRSLSSIMMRHSATSAPHFSMSRQAAFNVPPVANKSSTISTFCPGLMEFFWISNLSVPYSSEYSWLCRVPGSFPFFLIGTKATPRSAAIWKPKRKPRASRPQTTSTSGQLRFRWIRNNSFKARHTSPWLRALNMSLKLIQWISCLEIRNWLRAATITISTENLSQ